MKEIKTMFRKIDFVIDLTGAVLTGLCVYYSQTPDATILWSLAFMFFVLSLKIDTK